MLKFNLILAVGSLCTAVGHCVTVLLTLTLHFRVRVRLTLTLGGFHFNVWGFYINITYCIVRWFSRACAAAERARHDITMSPPHLRGTATGLLQCLRWSKADVEYLDQKRYDSAARVTTSGAVHWIGFSGAISGAVHRI